MLILVPTFHFFAFSIIRLSCFYLWQPLWRNGGPKLVRNARYLSLSSYGSKPLVYTHVDANNAHMPFGIIIPITCKYNFEEKQSNLLDTLANTLLCAVKLCLLPKYRMLDFRNKLSWQFDWLQLQSDGVVDMIPWTPCTACFVAIYSPKDLEFV